MRSLILNLGTSCFVKCRGCYNHFANSVSNNTQVEFESIARLLRSAREVGLEKVTFGGGDPLSRPDLLDLLHLAKDIGYRVHLDTVGTTFLGEASTIYYGRLTFGRFDVSNLVGAVDELGLPLDGPSSDSILRFRRGRPRIWHEIIQSVLLAKDVGLDVSINTVAHRQNINNLDDLAEQVVRLKVHRWQVFQFMPVGPLGKATESLFAIPAVDFQNIVDHLLSVPGVEEVLDAKSSSSRQGSYVIVDDSGTAWLPTLGRERVIVANVKDKPELVVAALQEITSR